MISVERFDSIAEVDRSAWDRLAADNVFASYGWLRTVEETYLYPRRFAYFVARSREGLLAAAPCQFQHVTTSVAGIDQALFGRFAAVARTLGMSAAPTLVCGARTGLSDHVLVRTDGPPQERSDLLRRVVDAVEAAADGERSTLCFRNVIDGGGPLAETLRARGYLRAAELPQTLLDVTWPSFGDYVRDLKTRHPSTASNIARERNRARRGGLVFRKLADPAPLQERLHALLDRQYRRLNGEPFPFRPCFLATLKGYLGERVVLYLALKDEEPVSVVVGVRAADTIFLIMVGFDDVRGRDGFVYFNNSYNEPIRDAIETGLSRIYSGKLTYEVKSRRGFQLVALSMYLYVPNRLLAAALRPILACQSALLRSRMARLTAARPAPRDA